MAGHNTPPDEIRRRSELRQHTADLGEFPIEELAGVFDIRDLHDLLLYQNSVSSDVLADNPYSEYFTAKYGEIQDLLGNNLSEYDQDVEDALASDDVVKTIRQARQQNPRNTELMTALRARRSAFVASMYILSLPGGDVVSIDKEAKPAEDEPEDPNGDLLSASGS